MDIDTGPGHFILNGSAISVTGMNIEEGYVACGKGGTPLVRIVKHETQDRYQIYISCPRSLGKESPVPR